MTLFCVVRAAAGGRSAIYRRQAFGRRKALG
jgi:hypothetical protein